MSDMDDMFKNTERIRKMINNLNLNIPAVEAARKVANEFNKTNILGDSAANFGKVNIPSMSVEKYYPFNVDEFDINPLKKYVEQMEKSNSLLANQALGIDPNKVINGWKGLLPNLDKIMPQLDKIDFNEQISDIKQSMDSIYDIKNENISNALDNIKNLIGSPDSEINNYQANNIEKVESKYFSDLANDEVSKNPSSSDIKENKSNNNKFFDGAKFEKVKINNDIQWKVDSDDEFSYKYGLLFNNKTGEVYKPVKKLSHSKVSSIVWVNILVKIFSVSMKIKDAKDCYDAIMWILSNFIHFISNL